jgi:TP901 family phage tail tape measure protein
MWQQETHDMAAGDLALNLIIGARNNAGGVIAGLGMSLTQLASGNVMGAVAVAGLAAGAAIVALGAKTTKMAADFQEGMTTLVTGAGESQKNLGLVSSGILNMAVQTGTSTKQLIEGMYMVESAGYHGAAGLQILQAAAEGAKVGNADLASVANGVTTALTDYKLPASQAAAVTNDLIATVASGKTHMQDLASALSTILPTSAAAGVSLKDTTAALATMTGEGTGAAQASTYLRQTILALEAPSKAASTTLQSVGLTTSQVSAEMKKSLPDALEMITEAIGKKFPVGSAGYIAALKNIVGGTKQLQGILELTGSHMAVFKGNVDAIASSVKNGGNSITGWNLVQQEFNFKMSQGKEVLETLGISIGQQLLPAISNLVSGIIPLISRFAAWLIQSHAIQNAINGIGAAFSWLGGVFNAVGGFFNSLQGPINQVGTGFRTIQPVLAGIGSLLASTFIPVWKQLVQTYNSQLKPAFDQLITSIKPLLPELEWIAQVVGGAVVVALILWVSVMVGVIKGLAGLVTGVIQVFGGIVQVISGAVQVVVGIVSLMVDLVTGHFNRLGNDLRSILNGIMSIWSGVWNIMEGTLRAAIGFITGLISGFSSTIVSIFTGLYHTLVGGSIVPDMVNGIVSWFSQLPGRALSAVTGLASQLGGFFNNLASQATSWGKNIIGGVVNGINSMVGSVESAASNVAGAIKNFLGFHSPTKKGPGTEAHKWAPALVEMYASGLLNGKPKIDAAVKQLSSLLTQLGPKPGKVGDKEIAGQVNAILPLLTKSEMSAFDKLIATKTTHTHPRASSTHTTSSKSSSSGSGCCCDGEQTIYIMLNGKQIGKAVNKFQAKDVRIQTNVRSL